MAGKKYEKRFESVDKEIQQVKTTVAKGIEEMRAEVTDLHRLMEEHMKKLTAVEKSKALASNMDRGSLTNQIQRCVWLEVARLGRRTMTATKGSWLDLRHTKRSVRGF